MIHRLIPPSDIISGIGEGLCALDRKGHITLLNPAGEALLGWKEAEALGEDFHDIVRPSHALTGLEGSGGESLPIALRPGETVRVEDGMFRRKDGTSFPVSYTSSAIVVDGQVIGTVIVFRDVGERRQIEEALKHQALHDALTDLPNRTLFSDRLEHAMHATRRNHTSLALLLLDLHGFKEVNDTYGHRYGDLLLQHLAGVFRHALRESDTVARLGGDEFAVVLPDTDEHGGRRAAAKLLEAVGRPLEIEGRTLCIGASIGIALYPEHAGDMDTLLHRADVAMYVAKHADSEYAVYGFDQEQRGPNRATLIGELQEAIQHKQLFLHYQPKVNVKTRQFDSVEALVRWQHPDHGLIPPDYFLPVAERAGLIKPLTLQVLNAALRQCRLWHEEGAAIRVSVNLSPDSLQDPKLADTIAALLETRRVEPSWLEVEIAENAIKRDPERASEILTRLHDMGVRIAVDDVGADLASLAYLEQLPIDEIKIDQTLVREKVAGRDDAIGVQQAIAMSHDLGVQVVVEGVENQETLSRLAGADCDFAQGFYLSRPLPAAELTQWFRGPASQLS